MDVSPLLDALPLPAGVLQLEHRSWMLPPFLMVSGCLPDALPSRSGVMSRGVRFRTLAGRRRGRGLCIWRVDAGLLLMRFGFLNFAFAIWLIYAVLLAGFGSDFFIWLVYAGLVMWVGFVGFAP